MNNEEQMRAEFDATGMFNVNPTFREVAWEGYKAATASKQREIDALNQQVLELSAQVNDLREALEFIPKSGSMLGHAAETKRLAALSATPPAALEAHNNEIAAKALEHAADHEDLYDKRHVLRRMAAELRSKK